jgi:hypothetical protein
MPTRCRLPSLLLTAALLAACSAPLNSPSAVTSASVPALPTLAQATPEPFGSAQPPATAQAAFPAIPGMSFDAARAWAEGFGFTCQEGLFPPNRSDALLAALCTRQAPSDNARMDLTIQYWPNNTVLAMSAALQPITTGSEPGAPVRTAFQRWASELPYAGADSGTVLDWLQSGEDCSAGCALKVGGVSWTRTSTKGLDAVSAFVPG